MRKSWVAIWVAIIVMVGLYYTVKLVVDSQFRNECVRSGGNVTEGFWSDSLECKRPGSA